MVTHTPISDRSRPIKASPPVSVGVGFVALDLLLIGRERVRANKKYAGGSCGNVLSILAYLDWASYPVARLGRDRRAQVLIDDLHLCHVNTTFVTKEGAGVTPAIVVRLTEDNGIRKARFEWKEPESGDWLPRYRPYPKRDAVRISPQLPSANVFYFDRAEASSLVLATAMREKGAVVFFEPSSCKDDGLFTECLAVSDIVKYSSDRILSPPRSPLANSPRLEVQTLGEKGLRYRLKDSTSQPGPWNILGAYSVDDVRDPTGCGDWCSAGIIARLCAGGRDSFRALSEDIIVEGLRFGQALAAINAEYEGARGPMYNLTSEELADRVSDLRRKFA